MSIKGILQKHNFEQPEKRIVYTSLFMGAIMFAQEGTHHSRVICRILTPSGPAMAYDSVCHSVVAVSQLAFPTSTIDAMLSTWFLLFVVGI